MCDDAGIIIHYLIYLFIERTLVKVTKSITRDEVKNANDYSRLFFKARLNVVNFVT